MRFEGDGSHNLFLWFVDFVRRRQVKLDLIANLNCQFAAATDGHSVHVKELGNQVVGIICISFLAHCKIPLIRPLLEGPALMTPRCY